MNRYTFAELNDVHLVYREARGNGREAPKNVPETLPSTTVATPYHVRIDRQATAGVWYIGDNKRTAGRSRTVRTPDLEEAMLDTIEEKPSSSTRTTASDLQIHHSTVWRVLKEQQLYPFHLQKVLALTAEDYPRRSAFCRWYINYTAVDPHFAGSVLVTDKATFTQDEIFNCHNMHMWEQENPHATSVRAHQQRFSLNVWCGLLDDFLIGPRVLPNRLTGETYLGFLVNAPPLLLEEVSLRVRQSTWYMHDGAPSHFSIQVRNHLNDAYPGRWIGCGSSVAWPTRSPDLNPLDFFFWGHLEILVYETTVETEADLLPRIQSACDDIHLASSNAPDSQC
jgi:hypothetical protein